MAASHPPLQTIIFDIGRVLVRVDVSRAMRSLAQGISLSPQELWTAIEKDPLWPDWQEGRLAPRDWHLHLAKRLGGSLSFDQFAPTLNSALDPQPIPDRSMVQCLRKEFSLGLLFDT